MICLKRLSAALVLTLTFTVICDAFTIPTFDEDSKTCSQSCPRDFDPDSNRVLKYDYKVETTTSMKGTSDQESKMIIAATVVVIPDSNCDFNLKLENVLIDGARNAFSTQLERNVLRFSKSNGLVGNLCPNSQETEESLNFKRGVLSSLQFGNSDEESRTLTEVDVVGECPTVYTLIKTSRTGESSWKKNKIMKECKHNQRLHQLALNVPDVNIQNIPLIQSSHECSVQVRKSLNLLTSSACTEVHTFKPFSSDGNGAVTEQLVSIVLTEESDVTPEFNFKDIAWTGKKSLLYEDVSSSMKSHANVGEVVELINDLLASPSALKPRHFSQVVNKMKYLDFVQLQDLYRILIQTSSTEKVMLDALGMLKTEDSIQFMVAIIKNEAVDSDITDEWLHNLALIKNPTKKMLSSLLAILDDNPKSSALLGISVLTSTYCQSNSQCESEQEVLNIIQKYESYLGSSCYSMGSAEEERVILSLKGLRNMGRISRSKGTLEKCYQEISNPMEIRLAAFETIRLLKCRDPSFGPGLKALFTNPGEDSELRIAAYLSIMSCPTKSEVDMVLDLLRREEVNQVGSFVWTHLTNLQESQSQTEHTKKLKKLLANEKLVNKWKSDARKFSRYFEQSLNMDNMDVGATVDGDLIFSQHSYLPRSARLNLTANVFGESLNLFEVGGRIEGFEDVVEDMLGPNGYFREDTLHKIAQSLRSKREIPSSPISKFQQTYNHHGVEEPKANVYARVFGKDVAFKSFHGMDDFSKLLPTRSGFNLEPVSFSKASMFLNGNILVPTMSGLPLTLATNGSYNLNFSSKLKIDFSSFLQTGITSIEVSLYPTATVEITGQMELSAHGSKTGLKSVTRLHTDTFVDGSAKMSGNKLISVKFKAPQNTLDLLDASVEFYSLKDGIYEPLESTNKEESAAICSPGFVEELFGIRGCASFKYHSCFEGNRAQIMFAGPSNLRIRLENTDQFDFYHFFYHWSPMDGNNMTALKISLDTPRSKETHLSSLDIVYNPKKLNFFNIDFKFPWQNIQTGLKYEWNDLRKQIKGFLSVEGKDLALLNLGYNHSNPNLQSITAILTYMSKDLMDWKGHCFVSPDHSWINGKLLSIFHSPVDLSGSYKRKGNRISVSSKIHSQPLELDLQAKAFAAKDSISVSGDYSFTIWKNKIERTKFSGKASSSSNGNGLQTRSFFLHMSNPNMKFEVNWQNQMIGTTYISNSGAIIVDENKYKIEQLFSLVDDEKANLVLGLTDVSSAKTYKIELLKKINSHEQMLQCRIDNIGGININTTLHHQSKRNPLVEKWNFKLENGPKIYEILVNLKETEFASFNSNLKLIWGDPDVDRLVANVIVELDNAADIDYKVQADVHLLDWPRIEALGRVKDLEDRTLAEFILNLGQNEYHAVFEHSPIPKSRERGIHLSLRWRQHIFKVELIYRFDSEIHAFHFTQEGFEPMEIFFQADSGYKNIDAKLVWNKDNVEEAQYSLRSRLNGTELSANVDSPQLTSSFQIRFEEMAVAFEALGGPYFVKFNGDYRNKQVRELRANLETSWPALRNVSFYLGNKLQKTDIEMYKIEFQQNKDQLGLVLAMKSYQDGKVRLKLRSESTLSDFDGAILESIVYPRTMEEVHVKVEYQKTRIFSLSLRNKDSAGDFKVVSVFGVLKLLEGSYQQDDKLSQFHLNYNDENELQASHTDQKTEFDLRSLALLGDSPLALHFLYENKDLTYKLDAQCLLGAKGMTLSGMVDIGSSSQGFLQLEKLCPNQPTKIRMQVSKEEFRFLWNEETLAFLETEDNFQSLRAGVLLKDTEMSTSYSYDNDTANLLLDVTQHESNAATIKTGSLSTMIKFNHHFPTFIEILARSWLQSDPHLHVVVRSDQDNVGTGEAALNVSYGVNHVNLHGKLQPMALQVDDDAWLHLQLDSSLDKLSHMSMKIHTNHVDPHTLGVKVTSKWTGSLLPDNFAPRMDLKVTTTMIGKSSLDATFHLLEQEDLKLKVELIDDASVKKLRLSIISWKLEEMWPSCGQEVAFSAILWTKANWGFELEMGVSGKESQASLKSSYSQGKGELGLILPTMGYQLDASYVRDGSGNLELWGKLNNLVEMNLKLMGLDNLMTDFKMSYFLTTNFKGSKYFKVDASFMCPSHENCLIGLKGVKDSENLLDLNLELKRGTNDEYSLLFTQVTRYTNLTLNVGVDCQENRANSKVILNQHQLLLKSSWEKSLEEARMNFIVEKRFQLDDTWKLEESITGQINGTTKNGVQAWDALLSSQDMQNHLQVNAHITPSDMNISGRGELPLLNLKDFSLQLVYSGMKGYGKFFTSVNSGRLLSPSVDASFSLEVDGQSLKVHMENGDDLLSLQYLSQEKFSISFYGVCHGKTLKGGFEFDGLNKMVRLSLLTSHPYNPYLHLDFHLKLCPPDLKGSSESYFRLSHNQESVLEIDLFCKGQQESGSSFVVEASFKSLGTWYATLQTDLEAGEGDSGHFVLNAATNLPYAWDQNLQMEGSFDFIDDLDQQLALTILHNARVFFDGTLHYALTSDTFDGVLKIDSSVLEVLNNLRFDIKYEIKTQPEMSIKFQKEDALVAMIKAIAELKTIIPTVHVYSSYPGFEHTKLSGQAEYHGPNVTIEIQVEGNEILESQIKAFLYQCGPKYGAKLNFTSSGLDANVNLNAELKLDDPWSAEILISDGSQDIAFKGKLSLNDNKEIQASFRSPFQGMEDVHIMGKAAKLKSGHNFETAFENNGHLQELQFSFSEEDDNFDFRLNLPTRNLNQVAIKRRSKRSLDASEGEFTLKTGGNNTVFNLEIIYDLSKQKFFFGCRGDSEDLFPKLELYIKWEAPSQAGTKGPIFDAESSLHLGNESYMISSTLTDQSFDFTMYTPFSYVKQFVILLNRSSTPENYSLKVFLNQMASLSASVAMKDSGAKASVSASWDHISFEAESSWQSLSFKGYMELITAYEDMKFARIEYDMEVTKDQSDDNLSEYLTRYKIQLEDCFFSRQIKEVGNVTHIVTVEETLTDMDFFGYKEMIQTTIVETPLNGDLYPIHVRYETELDGILTIKIETTMNTAPEGFTAHFKGDYFDLNVTFDGTLLLTPTTGQLVSKIDLKDGKTPFEVNFKYHNDDGNISMLGSVRNGSFSIANLTSNLNVQDLNNILFLLDYSDLYQDAVNVELQTKNFTLLTTKTKVVCPTLSLDLSSKAALLIDSDKGLLTLSESWNIIYSKLDGPLSHDLLMSLDWERHILTVKLDDTETGSTHFIRIAADETSKDLVDFGFEIESPCLGNHSALIQWNSLRLDIYELTMKLSIEESPIPKLDTKVYWSPELASSKVLLESCSTNFQFLGKRIQTSDLEYNLSFNNYSIDFIGKIEEDEAVFELDGTDLGLGSTLVTLSRQETASSATFNAHAVHDQHEVYLSLSTKDSIWNWDCNLRVVNNTNATETSGQILNLQIKTLEILPEVRGSLKMVGLSTNFEAEMATNILDIANYPDLVYLVINSGNKSHSLDATWDLNRKKGKIAYDMNGEKVLRIAVLQISEKKAEGFKIIWKSKYSSTYAARILHNLEGSKNFIQADVMKGREQMAHGKLEYSEDQTGEETMKKARVLATLSQPFAQSYDVKLAMKQSVGIFLLELASEINKKSASLNVQTNMESYMDVNAESSFDPMKVFIAQIYATDQGLSSKLQLNDNTATLSLQVIGVSYILKTGLKTRTEAFELNGKVNLLENSFGVTLFHDNKTLVANSVIQDNELTVNVISDFEGIKNVSFSGIQTIDTENRTTIIGQGTYGDLDLTLTSTFDLGKEFSLSIVCEEEVLDSVVTIESQVHSLDLRGSLNINDKKNLVKAGYKIEDGYINYYLDYTTPASSASLTTAVGMNLSNGFDISVNLFQDNPITKDQESLLSFKVTIMATSLNDFTFVFNVDSPPLGIEQKECQINFVLTTNSWYDFSVGSTFKMTGIPFAYDYLLKYKMTGSALGIQMKATTGPDAVKDLLKFSFSALKENVTNSPELQVALQGFGKVASLEGRLDLGDFRKLNNELSITGDFNKVGDKTRKNRYALKIAVSRFENRGYIMGKWDTWIDMRYKFFDNDLTGNVCVEQSIENKMCLYLKGNMSSSFGKLEMTMLNETVKIRVKRDTQGVLFSASDPQLGNLKFNLIDEFSQGLLAFKWNGKLNILRYSFEDLLNFSVNVTSPLVSSRDLSFKVAIAKDFRAVETFLEPAGDQPLFSIRFEAPQSGDKLTFAILHQWRCIPTLSLEFKQSAYNTFNLDLASKWRSQKMSLGVLVHPDRGTLEAEFPLHGQQSQLSLMGMKIFGKDLHTFKTTAHLKTGRGDLQGDGVVTVSEDGYIDCLMNIVYPRTDKEYTLKASYQPQPSFFTFVIVSNRRLNSLVKGYFKMNGANDINFSLSLATGQKISLSKTFENLIINFQDRPQRILSWIDFDLKSTSISDLKNGRLQGNFKLPQAEEMSFQVTWIFSELGRFLGSEIAIKNMLDQSIFFQAVKKITWKDSIGLSWTSKVIFEDSELATSNVNFEWNRQAALLEGTLVSDGTNYEIHLGFSNTATRKAIACHIGFPHQAYGTILDLHVESLTNVNILIQLDKPVDWLWLRKVQTSLKLSETVELSAILHISGFSDIGFSLKWHQNKDLDISWTRNGLLWLVRTSLENHLSYPVGPSADLKVKLRVFRNSLKRLDLGLTFISTPNKFVIRSVAEGRRFRMPVINFWISPNFSLHLSSIQDGGHCRTKCYNLGVSYQNDISLSIKKMDSSVKMTLNSPMWHHSPMWHSPAILIVQSNEISILVGDEKFFSLQLPDDDDDDSPYDNFYALELQSVHLKLWKNTQPLVEHGGHLTQGFTYGYSYSFLPRPNQLDLFSEGYISNSLWKSQGSGHENIHLFLTTSEQIYPQTLDKSVTFVMKRNFLKEQLESLSLESKIISPDEAPQKMSFNLDNVNEIAALHLTQPNKDYRHISISWDDQTFPSNLILNVDGFSLAPRTLRMTTSRMLPSTKFYLFKSEDGLHVPEVELLLGFSSDCELLANLTIFPSSFHPVAVSSYVKATLRGNKGFRIEARSDMAKLGVYERQMVANLGESIDQCFSFLLEMLEISGEESKSLMQWLNNGISGAYVGFKNFLLFLTDGDSSIWIGGYRLPNISAWLRGPYVRFSNLAEEIHCGVYSEIREFVTAMGDLISLDLLRAVVDEYVVKPIKFWKGMDWHIVDQSVHKAAIKFQNLLVTIDNCYKVLVTYQVDKVVEIVDVVFSEFAVEFFKWCQSIMNPLKVVTESISSGLERLAIPICQKFNDLKSLTLTTLDDYEFLNQLKDFIQKLNRFSHVIVYKLTPSDMNDFLKDLWDETVAFANLSVKLIQLVIKDEALVKYDFQVDSNNRMYTYNQELPLTLTSFFEMPSEIKLMRSESSSSFQSVQFSYSDFQHKILDLIHLVDKLVDTRHWLPPFNGYALITSNAIIHTFDGRQISLLQSDCQNYLLAADFQHNQFVLMGNFEDGKCKSLTIKTYRNDITVEMNLKVTVNGRIASLPMIMDDVSIRREASKVIVRDEKGIEIQCNQALGVCSVTLSGYYFDVTGGLMGNFDNEPYNDVLTPERKIAASEKEFIDSWNIQGSKKCFAARPKQYNNNHLLDNDRKICEILFTNDSSAMRPCYEKVDPYLFQKMCEEDLKSMANQPSKELGKCSSAAAYVESCHLHGVEMWMPKECITCHTNGSSHNQVGEVIMRLVEDEKADIVFLVEEHQCMQDVRIDVLAKQVQAAMASHAITDIRFAVVGFGGDGVLFEPHVYTGLSSETFSDLNDAMISISRLKSQLTSSVKRMNVLNALKFVGQLAFRPGVSRQSEILTCSGNPGESDFDGFEKLLHMVMEQPIKFHYLQDFQIPKNKVSKEVLEYTKYSVIYLESSRQKLLLPVPLNGQKNILRKDAISSIAILSGGSVFPLPKTGKNQGLFAKKIATAVANQIVASGKITETRRRCQECICMSSQYGIGYWNCYTCLLHQFSALTPQLKEDIDINSIMYDYSYEL